jgi:Zn-dependent metalloprotease
MRCTIVPPYLLARIARLEHPELAKAADAARRALVHDTPFRSVRVGAHEFPRGGEAGGGPQRVIHDARNTETLPGVIVRREGDEATPDVSVNEAYDGFGTTHRMFEQAYSRASIDGDNLPLHGTVHYGRAYDNAFWDGTRMVFGDGDGEIFARFTASLSVIGHELAHGVTQYTSNLVYRGQSGALNESISDVFGALVEQFAAGHRADEATWLIGDGLFADQVEGRALRSLKAPGTAYDDDILGKDPQPAHMSDFVNTEDDNGGVHVNSGIPNRAFYLVAATLGGHAWERAGQIWYDTITSASLSANSDFATFAAATTASAQARFGSGSPETHAVAGAWREVGVLT